MSDRQGFVMRNSLLATGALAILALLALFYSTVNGAVDRAARHRADGVAPVAAQSALTPQPRKLASLDPSGS